MKTLIQILCIITVLSVISCKKVEIPKPEDPPLNVSSPPFYIRGNFNGTELIKVVDGNLFSANTYSIPNDVFSGYIIPTYLFDLVGSESQGLPDISIRLFNHDCELDVTYDDILMSTSNSSLSFVGFFAPGAEIYNSITVDYYNDTAHFTSFFAINTPLLITEKKDTIVDNKSYRILGLSGDIFLNEIPSEQALFISDFKARIAFSL